MTPSSRAATRGSSPRRTPQRRSRAAGVHAARSARHALEPRPASARRTRGDPSPRPGRARAAQADGDRAPGAVGAVGDAPRRAAGVPAAGSRALTGVRARPVEGARPPVRAGCSPVHYVGIDLAWGERQRTGLAVLDADGHLVHVSSVHTDEEIRRRAGAVRRGPVPGRHRRPAHRHEPDRLAGRRAGAQQGLPPLRGRRAPVEHRQAGVRRTAPAAPGSAGCSASTWTRARAARAGRSRSTRTRRRSCCSAWPRR